MTIQPHPSGAEAGRDFERLIDHAHAMTKRVERAMLETRALRARVRLELHDAEQAVLRAGIALRDTSEQLEAARARGVREARVFSESGRQLVAEKERGRRASP